MPGPVSRARAGFDGLPVAVSDRDRAAHALARWLEAEGTRTCRDQLHAMIDAERWPVLFEAFHRPLVFGTGGQRAPVGLGPNRINPWTVAMLARGHAALLGRGGVVVAYDARRFDDRREQWVADAGNPVRGATSRALAEVAAAAYVEAGLRVWLQAAADSRYLSTPELSFAVRHLGADAGLMVSASHNPPDDNGLKVYDGDGAQIMSPDDDALAQAITEQDRLHLPDPLGVDHTLPVRPEVRQAWFDAVLATSRTPVRDARVGFTALHGVGAEGAMQVLRQAGFEVRPLGGQCVPDGAFPTLPGGIANPEVPAVFDRALAEAQDADLVLATDPDADRIGAAVRTGDGWRVLTGQEIAAVVVDHVLSHWSGPVPVVVQTEPTSRWVARIARDAGAEVFDRLPVGFKHVAGRIADLDRQGGLDRFAVGVEESHGVLTTAAVRDKDAACGALALAEAVSLALRAGGTLADRLAVLRSEHGGVHHAARSTRLTGPGARRRLLEALDALVADPPVALAGRAVRSVEDRRDEAGPLGPIRSPSDRRARTMVAIEVDGGRVLVRPSGTEPKVKAYAEVREGDPDALAQAVLDLVSPRRRAPASPGAPAPAAPR